MHETCEIRGVRKIPTTVLCDIIMRTYTIIIIHEKEKRRGAM